MKQHHIKMNKKQYQELASELYQRTVDFINEETIEMLYDEKVIEDTGDSAIHVANQVLYEFFNNRLTKNW